MKKARKYEELTVDMSVLISEEELEQCASRPASSLHYLRTELPDAVRPRIIKDGKMFFYREDSAELIGLLVRTPLCDWYKGPRLPSDPPPPQGDSGKG